MRLYCGYICAGNSEGKGPLGRSSYRWKRDVESDLKQIKWESATTLSYIEKILLIVFGNDFQWPVFTLF
jgi:hypothetical protein